MTARRVRRAPRRPFRRRWSMCGLGACAGLAISGPSSANGRFPQASQIVFDSADPAHLVVNTTFGLLESRDGARTFAWSCEEALGLGGDVDPMVAIPSSGAVVVATFVGIVTTTNGCEFRTPPELAGEIVPDLAWSAAAPDRVLAFRSVGLGDARYDAQVVRSEDDGATWERLVPPLASDLLPITIDAAPSDARRVYLSARLGPDDAFASVLLRSDDGGATFERTPVPETTGQRMAYIGAVHPSDPDRVLLRIDDPAGGGVWGSDDGGRSLHKLWSGRGALLGMAVSPDGQQLAVGGPDDGIWVGSIGGTGFEPRSPLAPTCLAWRADGLYACTNTSEVGFAVGRSLDGGRTFAPVFTMSSLCGPRECGGQGQVAAVCRSAWETLSPRVGTTCGVREAGADETPHDAGADLDAAAGPDVDAITPRAPSAPVVRATGGCAIGATPRGNGPAFWLALACTGRLWRWGKRRSRAAHFRAASAWSSKASPRPPSLGSGRETLS